jgi:site-specific recombinase XerD
MQQTRVTTLTSESIEQFRSTLSARGRSEKTTKGYCSDLGILLQELEEETIPMEDYEEVGMNWLQANRKRVAAKTTGRRLTSLKSFAKWAGWGDLFREYSAPVPPKGDPHPLPEGIDGVRRLISVCRNDKQRALIAMCGLVGARVSEALICTPADFDLNSNAVVIHGKGDKERVVPVSPEAMEILMPAITKAFIEGGSVVALRDRYARRCISELGVKAGLKRHISSHDLRATYATEIYNNTLDLRLVQELLGHSNSSTTEIYTKVHGAKMQAAVVFS